MFKKILLACSMSAMAISAAHAADVESAAGFDWTGAYIGVHLGYGEPSFDGVFDTGEGDSEDITFADDIDTDGLLGGIQGGYNYQMGSIVLGIEADLTFTDYSGSTVDVQNDVVEARVDYLASLRARAGFALDTLLIYATGGLAYADGEFGITDSGDPTYVHKIDEVGYVVGGGIEWAATEEVSLRVEGLYYGFGNKMKLDEDKPDVDEDDFMKLEDIIAVRAGVNLRF